jgi:hypothetical protein
MQQAAAKAAPFQLSPAGASSPSEGGTGGTGVTQKSSSSGVLSPGAIAGIAIGAVIVLALAASLCYFIGRSSSYRSMLRRGDKPDQQNAPLPDTSSVSSPQTDTSTIASPFNSPQPSMAIQGFSHLAPHSTYPAYPGYSVASNKDLPSVPYGGFSPGGRFENSTAGHEVYEHDGVEIQPVAGSPTSGPTSRSPPGPNRWA